ncbi:LamG domain-containing protein [Streptomyces sp. NY05-11A]|uniref:LamG domain-containing protein n=1 Tax=Streptomyces soliscabiei TaxID=588897 RepID=UPI0029BFCED7|nr:LamG domain-containing protein [Streptomyces sp. NY05-11A]
MAGLLQLGAVPTAAARPQTGAPAAKAAASQSGRTSGTTSGTTSGVGVTSAASEEEAIAAAKRSGKSVEVASLRGESSDVYATADGHLEAREYLRPVRTRINGSWQAIDTALAKADGGMVAPKAATVGLEFSGGGTGHPLVRLERAGRTLELSWPGAVPAPRLDGDTAVYPDILPDVDLRLGARPDGFTQLLVVKSAEAAHSGALAELRLKLNADGMAVSETPTGGLRAVDKGAGGVVFEAPTPVMWDSSPVAEGAPATASADPASARTTIRTTTRTRAASSVTAAVARTAARTVSAATDESTAPAAGPEDEPTAAESGRVERVGVDVAAGGDALVLTPDKALLTGFDTVYPVYIDPQWYSPKATSWTMVSRYWASSPQWKFNGDPDAGLGYCGWDYCAPYDVKRLFYQIPTTKFAGRTVLSAEFVVRETHAASCQKREVQLWRTKGISSSTTWNSQDNSDFWIDRLKTVSFAYGADGCAAADAEFDVKDAIADAAAKKWSNITLGMRASDEGDRYTWKRFSDDAYLRVRYNRAPNKITLSQLTMSPGGPCVASDKMVRIRSAATIRANDVTDPDGDAVSVQFQASWDAGDGAGWKARWTSARTTSKKSGSDFSLPLPSSIPKNKHVEWHVHSYDGAQWSAWSYTGSHGCHFMYDTSVPVGPTISSAQYGGSDPENPDDPWWDGVGRYGTFSVDTTSTDVTKYWFGVNAAPSSANVLTTSGGGVKTISFMPTKPGVNFITAQAFDAAGNGSEPTTYTFRVRSGQPERLAWQMDENAGASASAGAGGDWPATLHGATPGGPGVSGAGLSFNGTDAYAATDSPVLNTGKSFSVSLWAKLPGADPGHPSVALSQPGQNHSGFEIYYSSALGGWVFLRHADDASSGGTASRAVQPACATGDTACTTARLGEWTNLVGVFDNPNHQIKLYVGGKLVGSAAFTTPWDARGGTILGAGKHYGTLADFFPGSLDEVQLFDYQLNDAQVTKLAAKQPVDTGRPAKLVWPLDETDPAATAVTGRGQATDAVLKGGATAGTTGVNGHALTFDGVDDYATTGRPVLDTFQSFAVSAWVRLPKDKEARSMIAVSQLGSVRRSFELYHSSALGGWVFTRPEADTADAALVRATQTVCSAGTNCAAGRFGEWKQVVGVYDADAGKLLLYVNGVLQASTAYTARWSSEGPLTIGSGLTTAGAVSSPLKGDTDDVRLFDRAVSADEVRQLFKQRPLVGSRWKFESATGSPQVTPDASATGAGMTLYNGAATGSGWVDGGLTLDGVDDYAATATGVPTVDTSASFTVSGFVQAAAQPTGNVTLLSAPGTTKSAFAVRYVPGSGGADPGRWRIETADADSSTATATQVENGQFYNVQDWTHLALVYDGFARDLRLYVNGELQDVACADADENGEPDVTGCTDIDSSAENVVTFKAAQNLQLGRVKTGATTWGEYFPGTVSDLWTFQGALSDAQISRLAVGMPGVATAVPGDD